MFTLSQRRSIVRNHPLFAAAKHSKKPGFERMEFVRWHYTEFLKMKKEVN